VISRLGNPDISYSGKRIIAWAGIQTFEVADPNCRKDGNHSISGKVSLGISSE